MFSLLLPLLAAFAGQTQVSGPRAIEARVQQTGEAWGACVGGAARRLATTSSDVDLILDASLRECAAEEAAARQTYIAYLQSVGVATTPESIDQVFRDARPQLRQRLAGCIEARREQVADGIRRMC